MRWKWVVGATCVVIFCAAELRSLTALVIFVSGLVAKRYFNNFYDYLLSHDEYGWAYQHARAYAQGLHRTLRPDKCEDCTQKTPS